MGAFDPIRRLARRLARDESGVTTLEYAVLAAFVVLLFAVAAAAIREPAGSALDSSGNSIGTYPDP